MHGVPDHDFRDLVFRDEAGNVGNEVSVRPAVERLEPLGGQTQRVTQREPEAALSWIDS